MDGSGYTHVVDFGLLSQRVVQLENILSRLIRRVDDPREYDDLLVELEPIIAVKGQEPYRKESDGKGKGKKEGKGEEDKDMEDEEYDDDEQTPSVGEGSRRFSIASSMPSRNVPIQPYPPIRPAQTPLPANVPLHSMYPDSSLLTHRTSTGIGDIVSPTHPHQQLTRHRSSGSTSFPSYPQPRMNQLAHANGRVVTPSERDSYALAHGSGTLSHANLSLVQAHDTATGIGIGVEAPSRAPSETEHAAALTLEDMALGRGGNIERAGRKAEEEVPSVREEGGQVGDLVMGLDPKGKSTPDRIASDHPGLRNLPSPLQAQYIINFYLRNVDYLIRCIHVPTFQQQCRAFWVRPPGTAYSLEEMAFVALYAACLTVGLHLMGEPGRRDLGLSDDLAGKLTGSWWDVCFVALEKADWMQVHSITSLQAVM